jgi:hypothetical protein
MPLFESYRERFQCELLSDPYCRSGYEYAKRHDRLWQEQTAEALQNAVQAYIDLYLAQENRHSLGIAMYLHHLAESKLSRVQ